MSVIQAIILGLVQGITEYLPISSSAHLVIVPKLFGWQPHSLSFDLVLHLGTLLAVIIFFWAIIKKLTLSIFSKDIESRNNARAVAKNIIVSTICVVPLYIIIEKFGGALHDFSIVTVLSLLLLGILMIVISYRKEGPLNYKNLTLLQAGIIGVAQSLALINGVSRSGITIMVALLLGLKRQQANEYSFLISIPVILGGFVLDVLQSSFSLNSEPIYIMIIGVITSFIGGYFAIRFLMKYLNTHTLAAFGYYRIVLALLLIVLFFV